MKVTVNRPIEDDYDARRETDESDSEEGYEICLTRTATRREHTSFTVWASSEEEALETARAEWAAGLYDNDDWETDETLNLTHPTFEVI